MDVDFVKYLSGKSSKLLKVKHHDIPIKNLPKGGSIIFRALIKGNEVFASSLSQPHVFRKMKRKTRRSKIIIFPH